MGLSCSSRACSRAVCVALLLASAASVAQVINIGPDLLPQEEAFRFSTTMSDRQLDVKVEIAEGYYLYRDRVGARVLAGAATLGDLQLPKGKVYSDEFFGETQIYRDSLAYSASLERPKASGDLLMEFIVQGCADAGVCYPPYVTSYAFPSDGGQGVLTASNVPTQAVGFAPPADNTVGTVKALEDGSLLYIMLLFFNAGILLSFTPCVLPMVPIAVAVVTGGAKPGGRRAMALGGSYVFGMAIVYTLIGLLVAKSGGTFLTGSLQSPFVLIPMSLAFIALACVMYKNVNLRLLPASVRQRLEAVSSRPGTHSGALLAGGVSAVVVSPCVAVPLVGVLLFIASTGDAYLGGVALFSLSLGMGMLPLAVVAGAGRLIPKAGPLSEAIRKLFALALAGLGVWVLGALVPPAAKLVAYGILGVVGTAVLARAAMSSSVKARGRIAAVVVSVLLVAVSGVLLAGGLTGAQNELAPLAHLVGEKDAVLRFEEVSTEAEYQAATAPRVRRGTFEYYYADWCVSCRELEGYTFRDPDVQAALDGYRLLKIDLTSNDADSRRLLERGNLFGPPAIIVRDSGGMQRLRFVGYIDGDDLVEGLESLGR